MALRPKTTRGWLAWLLIIPPFMLVTNATVIVRSPFFWAAIAIVVLASVAISLRRRHLDAARERAWVGEFSFAESVRRVRGQEAQRLADEAARRAELLHRPVPTPA